MFKHPFFIFLFCTLVVIGVLHLLGTMFFLYWRLWYFDLIVHFLGGFWIGGMALWFVFFSGLLEEGSSRKYGTVFLGIGFAAVLIVGIAWEVFELIIWGPILASGTDSYFFDTSMDFTTDVLGALVATGYVLRRREPKKLPARTTDVVQSGGQANSYKLEL